MAELLLDQKKPLHESVFDKGIKWIPLSEEQNRPFNINLIKLEKKLKDQICKATKIYLCSLPYSLSDK